MKTLYLRGPATVFTSSTSKRAWALFKTAYDFIVETVAQGHGVIFVGTKKQAREAIIEESQRAGQYCVFHRWLGGMLTNFKTIKKSISRLKELEELRDTGALEQRVKKEQLSLMRELSKIERNLGGIKDMTKLPGAIFVVDPKRGEDRRGRGQPAQDSGGGHRRHQLRSGRYRLPDSG